MSNLYHLKSKPSNPQELHILIQDRILALVLHYGLTHFLTTCLDINCSQYGLNCKALSIDGALPMHLKNLIRTYGSGEVASLIRVMYQKELSKLENKSKQLKVS